MAYVRMTTWQKVRSWILGVFILLFVAGVFYLMHTGKQVAPAHAPTASTPDNYAGEDFGQFLVDHYALLAPFFEKNKQDLVTQGEPLLIKVMGDIILLNLAVGWVLSVGIAWGFAKLYVPQHANPQEAVVFATWRLGLDILVFFMASLGVFGWELANLPLPIWVVLVLFVLVDILVQSILVASIYGTTPPVSAGFYIFLFFIVLLVGAIISGSIIKKRISIMLSAFVDVQSVTDQLQQSTAEANRQLQVAQAARDDARQAVAQAQDQLDQIHQQAASVEKDIEAKQNSEAYVYGRIIRIRAQGDLASARDQIIAFMAKFPNGTLIATAKAQLDLINQDMSTESAQKRQAEIDAAKAAAQARADLLAQAAQGQVKLLDMRHALLGKKPEEIQNLFGAPTFTESGHWGYGKPMLFNPQANKSVGLSVYFFEGVVQSVDYYNGN